MPCIFSATAIFVRERRWPQPGWPVRGPWEHVTCVENRILLGADTLCDAGTWRRSVRRSTDAAFCRSTCAAWRRRRRSRPASVASTSCLRSSTAKVSRPTGGGWCIKLWVIASLGTGSVQASCWFLWCRRKASSVHAPDQSQHFCSSPLLLLAQQSRTVSRTSSGTRQSALTLSDVYWRRICLRDTSACSALKVDNFMRYINLLTYLLTTSSPFTDDATLRLRRPEWRSKPRPKIDNLIHHRHQRKRTARHTIWTVLPSSDHIRWDATSDVNGPQTTSQVCS